MYNKMIRQTTLVFLGIFLIGIVSAVQVCETYDDFSSENLDLNKWNEYSNIGFTDEHLVENNIYHISQNTEGDRETNLEPKRQFVNGESFSYELIYNSGSGNHASQPLINGNYPPSQIEVCSASGGCGVIGFWNSIPDLEAQNGTYEITFEFFSNQVKMKTIRPDDVEIINTFTGNSEPYNLTINTHTGHNGLLDFDYDNFILCSQLGEQDLESRIESLEQRVDELENRVSLLESLVNKIKGYFSFMTLGFKKQILCSELEESGENSTQDYGISCQIIERNGRERCFCDRV